MRFTLIKPYKYNEKIHNPYHSYPLTEGRQTNTKSTMKQERYLAELNVANFELPAAPNATPIANPSEIE